MQNFIELWLILFSIISFSLIFICMLEIITNDNQLPFYKMTFLDKIKFNMVRRGGIKMITYSIIFALFLSFLIALTEFLKK